MTRNPVDLVLGAETDRTLSAETTDSQDTGGNAWKPFYNIFQRPHERDHTTTPVHLVLCVPNVSARHDLGLG